MKTLKEIEENANVELEIYNQFLQYYLKSGLIIKKDENNPFPVGNFSETKIVSDDKSLEYEIEHLQKTNIKYTSILNGIEMLKEKYQFLYDELVGINNLL